MMSNHARSLSPLPFLWVECPSRSTSGRQELSRGGTSKNRRNVTPKFNIGVVVGNGIIFLVTICEPKKIEQPTNPNADSKGWPFFTCRGCGSSSSSSRKVAATVAPATQQESVDSWSDTSTASLFFLCLHASQQRAKNASAVKALSSQTQPPQLRFSNASLQHVYPTLFSNTSLRNAPPTLSTTLFSDTSLHHPSPALVYNTLLQHFSTNSPPTLLYNALLPRSSTSPFSSSSLQHTFLQLTLLQYCATTLFSHISLHHPSPTLLYITLL